MERTRDPADDIWHVTKKLKKEIETVKEKKLTFNSTMVTRPMFDHVDSAFPSVLYMLNKP